MIYSFMLLETIKLQSHRTKGRTLLSIITSWKIVCATLTISGNLFKIGSLTTDSEPVVIVFEDIKMTPKIMHEVILEKILHLQVALRTIKTVPFIHFNCFKT